MGYPLKMSIAKVACYLETANVRVCAHSPIVSLLGKERNATTSHFVSDCSAREMRYKAAFDLDNGEYRYANGIVLASGYVVSY